MIGPSNPPPEPTLEEKYAFALRSVALYREKAAKLRDSLQSIEPTVLYHVYGLDPEGSPEAVEIMKTTAKQYKVSYRGGMYTLDRTIVDRRGYIHPRKAYCFVFGWYLVSMMEDHIARNEEDSEAEAERAETLRRQLAEEEQAV
jgi:hypothetical protein